MLFEIRIMSGQQYSTKDSTVYGEAEVPEPPGIPDVPGTSMNPGYKIRFRTLVLYPMIRNALVARVHTAEGRSTKKTSLFVPVASGINCTSHKS